MQNDKWSPINKTKQTHNQIMYCIKHHRRAQSNAITQSNWIDGEKPF